MDAINNQKESGFTLVEISMGMIIIGLLIGGIFGGMALIENMKVNSTVQQIKKFESAALNFKQTYGYLPGDLANPTSVLSNCAAPCDLSGNQDGKVTSNGWNAWNALLSWNSEETAFWHHLAAANMVEGIIPDGGTGIVMGTHIPLSPFETGYGLTYNGIAGTGVRGSQIVLANSPYTTALGGTTANDLVIPGSAAQKLDEKIDNGDRYTGKFLAWNGLPIGPPYDITTNYGVRYLYNF